MEEDKGDQRRLLATMPNSEWMEARRLSAFPPRLVKISERAENNAQ
jgi:hypothetical protein